MLEYLRATCLLLRLWWYFRWKHEALTWLTCVWFCQSPSHWLSFWRLICFVLPWRTHAMYVKCLQSKDHMAIHGNYRGWFIVIILPSELSAFFHPFYGQVRRYMFLPFLPTNTKFSAQNHRSPNTGIRSLLSEQGIRSTSTWRKKIIMFITVHQGSWTLCEWEYEKPTLNITLELQHSL